MTDTMTMTEEELKAKIEEEVKKAVDETTEKLKKEHNELMAQQRIKAESDKKKAVEDATKNATLSAEEKAKKEEEERRKADLEELNALRLEKKVNDRARKLTEKGLPDFFKNDSRLINAEDGEVDNIIKTIEEEYKKVLPQGATTNTNVRGGGNPQPNDPFATFRKEGLKK